jgi:hypothetical protein
MIRTDCEAVIMSIFPLSHTSTVEPFNGVTFLARLANATAAEKQRGTHSTLISYKYDTTKGFGGRGVTGSNSKYANLDPQFGNTQSSWQQRWMSDVVLFVQLSEDEGLHSAAENFLSYSLLK